MKIRTNGMVALLWAGVALGLSAPPAGAVDAEAAKTLARQSNCFKCHATDKKKEGPSLKDISAKFKGKPDAVDTVTKWVTTPSKAKFADGHEEDHPALKTKDAGQVKNLVDWILSM